MLAVVALDCLSQLTGPGNCTSYTQSGNTIVFNCDSGKKISLQLCSPGIVRVWYSPSGEFKRNNVSFAVVNEVIEQVGNIQVEDQAQAYEIFTGKLRIRVNKLPFQLQVFDKYQKLLLSDHKDMGLMNDGSRTVSYKSLRPDEQFFGLGEKTGPLNRRGHAYKMWNSDKPCYATNEDPLYKSIPFFFSSYGYGIFLDNTYKTEFKFGTESNDYFSFEAPGGEMIYYLIYGNDNKQIIEQYIQLTGKPIMPPEWAFGFSQSRGMYTNEPLARSVAAEFRRRRIPCDIIYQDIGWVAGLQDFEWNKSRYTSPRQMLRSLDSLGFKMIVSQDPVISQRTAGQWREADSLGYFTTDKRTGKTYDMPWPWGGNCGVVDFTNPAVADWWGRLQQKPLNDGVRGFWTDMGEPAWSNEDAPERLFMQHHAGMHDEIHNVYGLTWDKVVKEQFEKRNPGKRVFQMTRAAYAGLQRYTFGWSGDSGNGNDVLEGWDRLANQIPLGLSAGMCGIPFWTTDISGYCGDIRDYPAMAELYTRWMQFGVFNPLSRAHHEGNTAVEPWMFGETAERNCRNAIEMKYRLFPFIYTYAREAHDKGLPLMRALPLEFPNDPQTFGINDEFMFGRELLVAPVVKQAAVSRTVYLPDGEWIDFNDSKKIYDGGQTIRYKAPLNIIPMFVRKGSIVPMMPVMQYIHERRDYPLTLHVYPSNEGGKASYELYEDDGETTGYQEDISCTTIFNCSTLADKYLLKIGARKNSGYSIPGKRDYIVKIYCGTRPGKVMLGTRSVASKGSSVFMTGIDKITRETSWTWDDRNGACIVRFPDDGKEKTVIVTK